MVDIEKTEKAIRDLLVAIGEDPDRPGLAETPKRCAKMYAELLAGTDRINMAVSIISVKYGQVLGTAQDAKKQTGHRDYYLLHIHLSRVS